MDLIQIRNKKGRGKRIINNKWNKEKFDRGVRIRMIFEDGNIRHRLDVSIFKQIWFFLFRGMRNELTIVKIEI